MMLWVALFALVATGFQNANFAVHEHDAAIAMLHAATVGACIVGGIGVLMALFP